MGSIARFIRKLWIGLRRERFAQNLDEEMAFHREQAEREFVAGGMNAAEARRAARAGPAVALRAE